MKDPNNEIMWETADHSKVLEKARELRSTDASKPAVLGGRNVHYVKGTKLGEFFESKGMSSVQVDALGNALLRENLILKCEIHDKNRKTLRPSLERTKVFERGPYFYVWLFEGSHWMRNLLLAVVVCSVLGLIMFPVWPQSAKVGVWYVSMTLLLALAAFICGRFGLFVLLYGVGIDFWILPNFFSDDLGVWESFKPTYTLEVVNRATFRQSAPYRVAVVIALASLVYWVYTQPTEFDEFVAQQRQFVDELYDGTLLSDKSQKEKEQIDKIIPDSATLERELRELEKQEREEAAQAAKLDAMINEAMDNDDDDS